MHNQEGECGTGALVPWAGSLWAITYAPHSWKGSSDKLYQISPTLEQTIRPESIGGTPANRMIHRETSQLLIGPYLISDQAEVRTIPYEDMPGRLTGTARHLTAPADMAYYATMEEGLYEVDLKSLKVTEKIADGHLKSAQPGSTRSKLPGYHGKGLYMGQERLIYSNNGEQSGAARKDPTVDSGALAEWHGTGDWELIKREQFTEVTGPGGLYGNKNADDPVWSMGWDARSLLLALLEDGEWSYYRLPKGSHSYDGAHGWNVEWPRIRDIGEDHLLATMHGTFWKFPSSFSRFNSAGITPRSNYLKVIGDFCQWNGKLVLGCDDSAQKEFLNVRNLKPKHAAPAQSNSNLWFVEPSLIDNLGPAIGRGSVWLRDRVKKNTPSDPFLFSGFDHRQLSLTHDHDAPVTFTLEIDLKGTNEWTTLRTLTVEPGLLTYHLFSPEEKGTWIRLRSERELNQVSAHFHYRNKDNRTTENHALFNGIGQLNEQAKTGVMRSLSYNSLGLISHKKGGYYTLDHNMDFTWNPDSAGAEKIKSEVQQPANVYRVDDASVIITEDGKTYRFPKNDSYEKAGNIRICREIATERDLLNMHGTLYELPARNAQGMAKVRPVATHNLVIHDFCSHAGLLLFTGITPEVKSEHIFRSADGEAAVWAGVADDLWKLGKPRGIGGPWKKSSVKAEAPSDPYLMTAYDEKKVEFLSSVDATFTLEVDIDGTDLWVPLKDFSLTAGKPLTYAFPEGFSAYWVRVKSNVDTTATAWFTYH